MILKKDKAIFLIHFCNDADQYKFWVSLLADAKEAKKHSIKLKISNHIDVETQVRSVQINKYASVFLRVCCT